MAETPNALTQLGGDVVLGRPPGPELGAAHQVAAPGGWAAFLDEAEYVPELTFPGSVITYHRMRADSQIEALHLGTTQPIREYRWMIDPNGAPSRLVENAAADLGLPIRGEADDLNVRRSARKFSFDEWLQDALLAPLYGFMDFEIVGRIEEATDWRMSKLAPRHPRTIQQIKEGPHGELEAIKQTFGPNYAQMPPPIPATSLVHLVWRPEAGSHVGRSMLRSMYREWLVKERTMKIAVVNIERGTGVPVIVGPQGASNAQLAQLGTMARQFKVAEGGGGAIPFGSKLELAAGSVPDAISLMTYCDEAMARVWALMLIQLGQTATGSRALGGEFAIYAARAQRLMGGWVVEVVNNFLDRYVEWNDPLADYAPRLTFEPSQPEGLSVTDLVALLDAGALTVDPEMEEWLRSEYSMPKKPEMPEHEDLGELTPDEVALVQSSRNPPALTPNPDIPTAPGGSEQGGKTFTPTPGPKKALDPTATQPTVASGVLSLPREHKGIRASLTLPERPLRRAPSANEIRAAVDFAGLDNAHREAVSKLHHDYINGTLPAQIDHLADQIRQGRKASEIAAPIVGHDRLVEHLQAAARSGVQSGIREAQVQGITFTPSQTAAAGDRAAIRAAEQAEHVANLNARGLTLGAQRRAGRVLNTLRGRERAAKDLEAHLTGQKHVYERENLKGAVTTAQNAGRIAAMEAVSPLTATATYEASEILDDRTCGPCEAVDGTEYDSLEEAQGDYGSGGYVDCEGGPNCRGTLVAVYGEQNPETGEGPLGEAEPSYLGPGGSDGGGEDTASPEDAGEAAPEIETPAVEPVAEPTPEPSVTAGPLLTEARTVESHADAVRFVREKLGIANVNFGKLERQSQAPRTAEQAMTILKGTVESMAEARDVFGDALQIDHVVTRAEWNEMFPARSSRMAAQAYAAVGRSSEMRGIGGGQLGIGKVVRLIINDDMPLGIAASANARAEQNGFLAEASRDVRGRIMHEMGHALEYSMGGFGLRLPGFLAESGLAATAETRGTAAFVSKYATTQSVETWAESFSTLMRPGGVAADFSVAPGVLDAARLRFAEGDARRTFIENADANTKASLVKLRDLVNNYIAETHPDLGQIPER